MCVCAAGAARPADSCAAQRFCFVASIFWYADAAKFLASWEWQMRIELFVMCGVCKLQML